jgi:hypothetical protein
VGKLNLVVAVLLALVAATLDVLALATRCPVSPGVNVPLLLLGLVLQATAVAFPVFFGQPFADELSKRGLAIVGMALLIFTAGSLAFWYSAQFSDVIGKPNYFRSVGLACWGTV